MCDLGMALRLGFRKTEIDSGAYVEYIRYV